MNHDPSMEDLLALTKEVESRACLAGSPDHGAHHWRLVAWTGSRLIEHVPDADELVMFLFALFHDSQRETEFHDPDHGRRGAQLARELVPSRLPGFAGDRLDVLLEACELHTEAPPTDHPTLGLCWDSDRLNLWRVGITPSPRYLSTEEARKPERIAWAEELQGQDFDWATVWSRYTKIR